MHAAQQKDQGRNICQRETSRALEGGEELSRQPGHQPCIERGEGKLPVVPQVRLVSSCRKKK